MQGDGFDEFLADYNPADYERTQREPVLDPRRKGRFTASEIHKLLSNGRKKDTMGQYAKTYIEEVACAALTGERKSFFRTAAMQWGIDHELEGIAEAEKVLGICFENTGDNQKFIISPCDNYGGTPDGIIHGVAGIDVKCPETKTHLRYRGLANAEDLKAVAPEYYWQIQCLLSLSGVSLWYFCSYDPRLPRADFRLHLLRVEPNEADIAAMKERIYAANEIKNRIIETGII